MNLKMPPAHGAGGAHSRHCGLPFDRWAEGTRDRWLFGVLICLALHANVLAQTSPDAENAAQAVAAPSDTPVATTERQARPPPRPQPGFKPSEKIRADSAVSFPVDI